MKIQENEENPSFVPHMTLGFICNDFDLNSVDIKNKTVKIDSLTLSWGGDLEHYKLGENK
jgi:2'-5' RNA ligase